ncbi:lasso RiPP family leader peptide-containing protein [Lentzea guizhouensis]|nr:lasso RiPP family leader peptide-containing protein [Lentzea guizhouensis]
MSAGTWTPSGSVSNEKYETPSIIEAGGVVDLTNGGGREDTADMRKYYY